MEIDAPKDGKSQYCTMYIVRHGLTEWNMKGVVMGHSDVPLAKEGEQQARELGDLFKDIHFDAIFSSDLLRAHKTAELIKMDRELAVQTSHLLRERSYGHFEGKPVAEYKEGVKHLLVEMQKLPKEKQWQFKFGKDMESNEEVVARFVTKLREIAVAYADKTVLVVAHGGVIRTFLLHMGYATQEELPTGSIKNGGYLVIRSDGLDFFIKDVVGVEKVKK